MAQQHQHQGRHGVGHDKWHESFYSKLIRKDKKTSCCNLADCSPTTSRMIGDRYEVLVEGEWTPVPQDTIQNVTAPDGGAHVCAPKQQGIHKGMLYCVVCCRRRREPGRRRICDLAAAFRTRAHRRREDPLLR